MTFTREEAAAELAAIAETDAKLQKRIDRLMRHAPADIKARIEATALANEAGYAKDAADLAGALFAELEAA